VVGADLISQEGIIEGELPFSCSPSVIRRLSRAFAGTDDGGDNRYLVMGTDRPVQDQYGRVTIVRGR
jgi:hypothetical protein